MKLKRHFSTPMDHGRPSEEETIRQYLTNAIVWRNSSQVEFKKEGQTCHEGRERTIFVQLLLE